MCSSYSRRRAARRPSGPVKAVAWRSAPAVGRHSPAGAASGPVALSQLTTASMTAPSAMAAMPGTPSSSPSCWRW
ncbi:hypothetical protein LJC64_01965 [Ruminococcaceae bacterium OttesenSCG-928-A11]|nr:hypothetical protein [Ruminococcaceae bacterium OttesenSCG-928-A11]